MLNWILQKNLTRPTILERLKAVLEKENELYEEVEMIPFSKQLPKINNKTAFPIIYGSTTFMLNAFEDKQLKVGVFYNPATFNMQNYVTRWGDKVLNADGQLLLFGQLNKLNSTANTKWFIRPNDDAKGFSGRVVTYKELIDWSEQICTLQLPDFNATTKVWIAAPKTIQKEWRLFIVDNEIVACSRYMKDGVLNENQDDQPEAMIAFAKTCIATYRLHEVYVMDIAQTEKGFRLIECNCFNGTGFYGHDVGGVVRAINAFIKKDNEN